MIVPDLEKARYSILLSGLISISRRANVWQVSMPFMCLRNNSRPHHNHPSQATSSHHITSHPIPFFPGTFCVLFTYQPPRTAQPYQTLRAPIPTAGQRSHVPKTIHISPPENPKKTPTYVMLCSGSNNPYMPARPVMSAACGVFI